MVMDLSQGSREDLASCLPAGTCNSQAWPQDGAVTVHMATLGAEARGRREWGPTDVQLSGFFTWGLNTGKRADVEGSQGS